MEDDDRFYGSEPFQAYFQKSCQSLILKANPPYFTVLAVSNQYLELTHKQRGDLLNKNLFDVFPGSQNNPGEQSHVYDALLKVINTKATIELPVFTYELTTGTGASEKRYWSNTNEPILDSAGSVAYIINTSADATWQVEQEQVLEAAKTHKQELDREQALNEELFRTQLRLQTLNDELEERVARRTAALAISEARLRSIIEQAPLAFCILEGPDLVITFANDRMLKIWNKPSSIIGQVHAHTRTAPGDDAFLAILDEVYTTGISYSANEVKAFTDPDNIDSWGYFSFVYQAIRDDKEKITSVLVMVNDVTETVLARNENNRVNEQLRLAVEAANLGSWYIHPTTKALEYNATLAKIFGYEGADKMTYDQAIAQVTPEYQVAIAAEIEKAIIEGGDYDFTYSQRRFNDGETIWLRSLGKISPDENGAYTIFSGVVMDITVQTKAVQSIAESEERFRTMAEGTNVLIAVGDESSNATYFNSAWVQLTGRSMKSLLQFGWVDLVHPEDREQYVNIYLSAFKKEEPFTGEFRILNKEGEYRWLLAQGPPRFRADGSFAGYISSCIDITEQKKNDQRKNDFIGMVSHELKTPLTSLSAYIQVLQGRSKKVGDVLTTSMLDKSYNQVKRMTSLINGFLNMSRLESGSIQVDKTTFLLNNLIQEMIEEAAITQPTHTLTFQPCNSIMVHADRDKIGSVLSNLLSNAIKYSHPGQRVVEISCKQTAEAVQLSIADKGIGIAPEDYEKLFERYFRAEVDPTISGFGIGLYLTAEIVERHNGKIWVESKPGIGSIFSFTLPLQTIG